MATVDPDDDSIRRFVVRYYRYDPTRREFRHQVVAAFDNRRQFERLISTLADELRRRRADGHAVDRREHPSGVVLQAGHRRRQAAFRLWRRAAARGVRLSDQTVAGLDLPDNVQFLHSSR